MDIVSSLIVIFFPIYTASADSSILIDSTTYLYGNVKFNHNAIEINSKKSIVTKDKVSAYDSVIILKDDLKILTDFGEYFWNKEIKIHNGFVANKKHETLTGKEARYFEDRLWITDSVKYINNNDNWVVYGQQGFYDVKSHFAMITDSPKFEAPQDSIEILGDTIKIFSDTLTKVVHNAIIKLSETQCMAESLIYLPKKDEVLLYGKPIIISATDSLKGEEMEITLSDKKIERVLVKGEVFGKRWKF